MDKENALQFMLCAYMNITDTATERDIVKRCIRLAYLDLCRTIEFKEDNEKSRKTMYNDAENCVMNKKDGFYALIKSKNVDDFKKMHEKICNNIISAYNNVLSYGQAQKWLNMTMKYILIIEVITTKNLGVSKVKDYLHIPIDNYILAAIKDEFGTGSRKVVFSEKFKILNTDKIGRSLEYTGNSCGDCTMKNCPMNKEKKFSWSKIPCYKVYYDFQIELRKKIAGKSLIDWENENWITMAEKIYTAEEQNEKYI